MDPGSSTGDDGRDMERGRLGRGLCISRDGLGHMDALDAGERIISLRIASRLDAELARAECWRADAGLRHDGWLSSRGMVRLRRGGRFRVDFGVLCHRVSEW